MIEIMTNMVIVSDFDGTITEKDSLYHFFKTCADKKWLDVEKLWSEGKISSKECLKKQFELVDNLCPELIEDYTNSIRLDPYFKEFNQWRLEKGLDLIVASDGIDYFINKILQKNDIKGIEIVSNHGEFQNGKFVLSFPNQAPDCAYGSGTCKCHVVKKLRQKYEKIVYIGDGISDYCVAKCADILFAKSSLLTYCIKKRVNHIKYKDFKGVIEYGCFN